MNHIKAKCNIPESCREYFLTRGKIPVDSFRKRGLTVAGISELHAGYEIGRPDHGDNLALFVFEGEARYRDENREGKLLPGQLWLFPAHIPYHYIVENYWKICWFHFAEADPWHYLPQKQIQMIANIDCSELLEFSRSYYRESLRSDRAKTALHALAELIGIHLDRLLKPPCSAREAEIRNKLHALWQKIDTQPGYPWTVTKMAKYLHRSVPQFRRIVQQCEQITPQQKLTQLRMERTQQLLTSTDHTLDMISEMVGYCSPFSLSRVFKKETGQSPRKYRAESSSPQN